MSKREHWGDSEWCCPGGRGETAEEKARREAKRAYIIAEFSGLQSWKELLEWATGKQFYLNDWQGYITVNVDGTTEFESEDGVSEGPPFLKVIQDRELLEYKGEMITGLID